MRIAAPIVGAALLLSGCENSCQLLCDSMADLAEECGVSISDAELDQCREDYADAPASDLGYCATYATPEALRRVWDCSDVELFRNGPPADE